MLALLAADEQPAPATPLLSPAVRVSVSSPSHVHGRRSSNGSVTVAAERKSTFERDNKRRGEKFDIPFESSCTAHVSPTPSPSNGSSHRQPNPAKPNPANATTQSEELTHKQGSESKGDDSPRAVLQEIKMKKLRELEQKSHVREHSIYISSHTSYTILKYISSPHVGPLKSPSASHRPRSTCTCVPR